MIKAITQPIISTAAMMKAVNPVESYMKGEVYLLPTIEIESTHLLAVQTCKLHLLHSWLSNLHVPCRIGKTIIVHETKIDIDKLNMNGK